MYQPPKQTILHVNHNEKSLSGEAGQSSWVTLKKRDCPRPLPMLTTMGSRCLWYISNLDHFLNWKMSVCQKSQSNFRTGKNLSKLEYFSILKMNVLNSIICHFSLPTWRVISSLSTKGVAYFWIEALSGYMLPAHLWGYIGALILLRGLYLE